MNGPQFAHPYLNRLGRQSLMAAVLGGGLCALGAVVNREQFFQSYLAAFVLWWGISVGSLALAMLHHLVHGKWGLATAPLLESAAATMPVTALLFVPVLLGMEHLYPWAQPGSAKLLHGDFTAAYLSERAWSVRAVAYFVIWIVLAWVLNRWSATQKKAPDRRRAQNLARLSAGGLVVLALTVTFAAMDWMMSLEPAWYSTIYGALVAVGAVLSGLAFAIVILARIRVARPESAKGVAPNHALPSGQGVPPEFNVADAGVFNDLGNLLLAFLMLWAYMAFSQFLIIWSGDQPQESVWYFRRLQNGWQWLALAVVVLHFAVPFLMLLSRDVKRNPRRLAMLACGLLGMRYLDLYWTIGPAFPESHVSVEWKGATWAVPRIHWLDLVTPVAVGGIWMAVFVRQLKKRSGLLSLEDLQGENTAEPENG